MSEKRFHDADGSVHRRRENLKGLNSNMGRRQKQSWRTGDYFLIPLEDQTQGIGQVLSQEPGAMGKPAICAFFGRRLNSEALPLPNDLKADDVIAVQFVTVDLLNLGVWSVFAHGEPLNPTTYYPDLEERRSIEGGFKGVWIRGSGIMRKLVNAYFALHPWDGFAEPDYLDTLLLSPSLKPAHILLRGATLQT